MRPDPAPRRVLAPLDLLPFPRLPEVAVGLACPHCSSSLTLHQPDPESPDRLLGVCGGCKHWYLIDPSTDRDDGVLLGLPDDKLVRALSRANPSGGTSLMGHEPVPGQSPPAAPPVE
jgi:hypothetical protein